MNSSIVIAGSSNTDMVIKTEHLPSPGETVLGGNFFMSPGGKGANQAVAAARLGGNVIFIAKTGNDIFGKEAVELFRKEGIDTTYIQTDYINPSGIALITVDSNAENCIAVASGANAALLPADIDPAISALQKASLVLVQLEIPLETVEHLASISYNLKLPFILNPAPACQLPENLFPKISIITPNEKEASMLSGITVNNRKDAEAAAISLYDKGVATVIITMGSQGALLYHEKQFTLVDAPVVKAVDTTAAGDVFNGALAAALCEGMELTDAVRYSCRAAAISVTRLGAQSSAPYKQEMESK